MLSFSHFPLELYDWTQVNKVVYRLIKWQTKPRCCDNHDGGGHTLKEWFYVVNWMHACYYYITPEITYGQVIGNDRVIMYHDWSVSTDNHDVFRFWFEFIQIWTRSSCWESLMTSKESSRCCLVSAPVSTSRNPMELPSGPSTQSTQSCLPAQKKRVALISDNTFLGRK